MNLVLYDLIVNRPDPGCWSRLFSLLLFLATRFRKISGNLSENSSCSLKEIRIWKPGSSHVDDDSQGQTKGGHSNRSYGVEERLVFVAGERKIPFAICSIIPSQKASTLNAKSSGHRYNNVMHVVCVLIKNKDKLAITIRLNLIYLQNDNHWLFLFAS